MNDTTKPRSALGTALVLHQEAVEHCESLYLQHAGEETDEVAAAEARRDLAAREALEALTRYHGWLADRDAAVARERAEIERFEADTRRRRQWAEEQIATLAEHVAPGRSRVQVGTRTVALRRSTAVETDDELLDLRFVPASWLREVPEVPARPATFALDKAAAKADMLHGYREGPPPNEGWYDVEHVGHVWLRHDNGKPPCWWMSHGPEYKGATVHEQGLAVGDNVAGLDVLRWKPAAPGVRLVHRTHVRVG